MHDRGVLLVVGGLGLFTAVMLATPDSGGWVFAGWILVLVAMADVGAGLILAARGHAARTGALTNDAERPPPWPPPDPIYLWPGPRLLGGDVLQLENDGAEPVVPSPEPAPVVWVVPSRPGLPSLASAQTQEIGDPVVATGGVAPVNGDGLAGDERGI